MGTTVLNPITIRLAGPRDAARLRALAQLDSSPIPSAPALLAESGERLLAALPVTGGDAVADPFRPTRDVVELLRVRAAALATAATSKPGGARRRTWRSGLAVRAKPGALPG